MCILWVKATETTCCTRSLTPLGKDTKTGYCISWRIWKRFKLEHTISCSYIYNPVIYITTVKDQWRTKDICKLISWNQFTFPFIIFLQKLSKLLFQIFQFRISLLLRIVRNSKFRWWFRYNQLHSLRTLRSILANWKLLPFFMLEPLLL